MAFEVVITYPTKVGDLGTPKEFLKTKDGDLAGRIEYTEFGIVFSFEKEENVWCEDDQKHSRSDYVVLQYWEGCDPDGVDANVAGSDDPKS